MVSSRSVQYKLWRVVGSLSLWLQRVLISDLIVGMKVM
jgi:hypothetical protein